MERCLCELSQARVFLNDRLKNVIRMYLFVNVTDFYGILLTQLIRQLKRLWT